MPYIAQDRREVFDEGIYAAAENIESVGELNYVVSKIAALCLLGSEGRYADFNGILGALNEAQAEFRRRYLVPYENEKIEQYGDLFDG